MPDRISLAVGIVCCLMAVPATLQAQDEPEQDPCSGEQHRQFDFWMGDWDVRAPDGRLLGRNSIAPIHGGCGLRESWTGAQGNTGTSLNGWDASAGRWRQMWIGSGGLVLALEGGLRENAMTLEGVRRGEDGSSALHRITWTPLPDGAVRQHWQVSADDGATWRSIFDGIYRRAGSASRER